MYSLFGQLSADSMRRLLTEFIVIETQIHIFDVRIILYHLPQDMIGYTAAGGIAVAFPVILVHGYKAAMPRMQKSRSPHSHRFAVAFRFCGYRYCVM